MFFWNSCSFDDPAVVGNLISGSSAFSKTSLNIWKFTYCWSLVWRILSITSMWDECNCWVVWAFFDIAFLWDWNENWLFQSCFRYWVFQMCWHIGCSTFTSSSWNIQPGIPSPLLSLFIVMLSKVHLTSHSRVSGSRWVMTPLWLSGSWRSFLYSLLCILATSS